MLKGIDPLLNADVLFALRAMGHGDDLILVDTNFPADSVARETAYGEVLRIDRPVSEVMRAVLTVFPVEAAEVGAVGRMAVGDDPAAILPVMEEAAAELTAAGVTADMVAIERFEFYDRARSAYAVVQTAERRFFGCFALRKGIIGPDDD